MSILMAGVEFASAPLQEREKFAFVRAAAAAAMRRAAALPGIGGCVLYSTCNRTELWLDAADGAQADAAALLCALSPRGGAAELVTRRGGRDAVTHLFETACGLKSQIWGEDQILTQIRDAISGAREAGTASERLEKLFQLAVTSAKRVKTQVRFSEGNASVAEAAAALLAGRSGGLEGARCLVIGSGQMGRLMARRLAGRGADVTMTLRQYKYGVGAVPERCRTIPYGERAGGMEEAEIVVSATASPHYTVRCTDVSPLKRLPGGDRIFLDLAVPRDIEPAVGGLGGCTLLTLDDLRCTDRQEERASTAAAAGRVIGRYIGEYERWLRAQAAHVQIEEYAADFSGRLARKLAAEIGRPEMTPAQQEWLCARIRAVAEHDARHLLFAFRQSLEERGGSLSESCS